MAKIVTGADRDRVTVNTNNVWERIVGIENSLDNVETNYTPRLTNVESQLTQNTTQVTALTSDGYVHADLLGLQKFDTETLARANVSVNNAAKLQPYLNQGYKIRWSKGYYPFEKELLWGNNSMVGGGKTVSHLVFPSSKGIVFNKSGFYEALVISDLRIISNGHCIDFKNDGISFPNNVYQNDFSRMYLHSETGSCVYAGNNKGIGGDQLVFEQKFSHIRVTAPMGAGFYGIGGLGVRFEYINDANSIKNVFQNCNGQFYNVNTSFAGAEYFLLFDNDYPDNFGLTLDFYNVNMETIKKGAIRVEKANVHVKHLILNRSSFTLKHPTDGSLLTEAPFYFSGVDRIDIINSNGDATGTATYPEHYDTSVVKSPFQITQATAPAEVNTSNSFVIYFSSSNTLVEYNKNFNYEFSIYDYNSGKKRYKLYEELHAKTLRGGKEPKVMSITDRNNTLNLIDEYHDDFRYELTSDLTLNNLILHNQTAAGRKITVGNSRTATANLIFTHNYGASGKFYLFGNKSVTLLPGEMLHFVYENVGGVTSWKQLITADDIATLTSITSTPLYVGQFAVVGGVGYISTGTASTADWKQITN